MREDVEAAARSLSSGDESLLNPLHGALLVNLRNIADAMASVARAQPVRSPRPGPARAAAAAPDVAVVTRPSA